MSLNLKEIDWLIQDVPEWSCVVPRRDVDELLRAFREARIALRSTLTFARETDEAFHDEMSLNPYREPGILREARTVLEGVRDG